MKIEKVFKDLMIWLIYIEDRLQRNHIFFQRKIIEYGENTLNNLFLFIRTTGPISAKLGTKHSGFKGF